MFKTLLYIFISFLVAIPCQDALTQNAVKPLPRPQSIALGVDLWPLAVRAFDDSRTGLNVTARYGLRDKVFVNAELGYENVDYQHQQSTQESGSDALSVNEYKHISNGSFLRAGLDYNFFHPEEEPYNNDFVGVGFRYGYAFQQQESPSYTIENGYWNNASGSGAAESVNSHWVEVLFSLRTELFRNFYAGWSIRGKMLAYSGKPGVMEPYAIPGFGKTGSRLSVGFTYSLEYQIPFGKRKEVVKP